MKKEKQHRIADVARRAGVSEATVSVVVNNRVGKSIRVSDETQQRVWDAVRDLGYVPNPSARNLARGRNNLIAVFSFESIFPLDSRNFYYPFLIGIEEEAATQGYDLLLITAASDPTMRGHIYHNGSNRLQLADGAVLLGHAADQSEVTRLLSSAFPFVYVGRRESPNDDISYAAGDYVSATRQLIEYLFAHQHQRLAYLAPPVQTEASRDRYRGFVEAHAQRGIAIDPNLSWYGGVDTFTTETFTHLVGLGATAFVAENDQIALRVLDEAKTAALRCPEDFSLVVLGDPLTIVENDTHWTTYKIPRREMGREAVRLLVTILSGTSELPRPYRTVLPCQFIPGSTVSVAKKE
ncbi:MAG: LacI family DNA-binding transcriptional regulator [Chloroflexota bacterium]|nr:LacI family DNA-binding transcriptional regulator [Chloroflexota bacterium]